MKRFAWASLAALCLFAFVAGSVHAATVASESTWGGAQSEGARGVETASDGSIYLVGRTFSFDPFQRPHVFALKYAQDGSLVWQRAWDGPEQFGNDEGSDVAVAADGSIYVSGSTIGVGNDALLLKLAPDGSLLWQRRWGGNANDGGESVAVGPDGSVYLAGTTSSFGDGSSHAFVVKFAPDGTLVWQRVTPGSGQGVAVASDGSVYVAGVNTRPNVFFEFDLMLLKIDPSGALVWQRAYSALEIADARGGVTVAPDSSIYVAGTVQDSDPKVVVHALLVKFAPDGTLLWDREWGGRSGDTGEGVAVAPDGTVYFSGNSNSFGAGSDDAFLVQVSADGRGLDGNTWGGAEIEHGDAVHVAPDGTILLGATASTPPWSFLRAPSRLARLRGTVATPTNPLLDATGTVADPAGTLFTPNGSTTFAGSTDAALLRITL
jgi:uncharacterized delta-60 repeat protein